MTTQAIARLSAIEALRGVAAVAVILFHTARHVDTAFGAPQLLLAFQAGHSGVDVFFVISGFIILFVHGRDFDRPGRIWHYLGRRCSRVLPLYWVALALTLAMLAAGRHGLPDAGTIGWQALLLPTSTSPLLGIAWTLQFEVIFYLVFALLILRKRVGLIIMAALTLPLAYIAATGEGTSLAGVETDVCGVYGLDFCLGMASAHILRLGVLRPDGPASARNLMWLAAFLLLASVVVENAGLMEGHRVAGRFAYSIPAALMIAATAAREQEVGLAVPGLLRVCGSASYSIYLFQFVFIGMAWQMLLLTGLAHRLAPTLIFVVLAGAAVIGGIGMSYWVEKPLLRLIRGGTQGSAGIYAGWRSYRDRGVARAPEPPGGRARVEQADE